MKKRTAWNKGMKIITKKAMEREDYKIDKHRKTVSKSHNIVFKDNVLECSCGWREEGKLWNKNSIERMTNYHLDNVK